MTKDEFANDPEEHPDFRTWTWDVWVSGGNWVAEYGWKKPTEKVVNLRPLYTTPQRTWVGLTDEEKAQFVVAYYPSNWDRKTAVSLMSDYEKYLKEKNHV